MFYAQLITDLVVLIIGISLMTSAFRSMRAEEKENRKKSFVCGRRNAG